MNKSVEYKNIAEFIELVFPNTYKERELSSDASLEVFMKKNSENFKLKINNIFNNKSNGA